MNGKKSLILFFNEYEEEFIKSINANKDIDARCVFRPVNKILRAVRRYHIYSNLPGVSLWLGGWKKHIRDYGNIICISSDYAYRVLRWVRGKNPKAKVMNYFWDAIEISKYKVKEYKGIENWSFDEQDATKYSLQYNPQFYVNQVNFPSEDILYDVVFIGSDRHGVMQDRRRILSDLYIRLNKMGCSCKICLLTKSKDVVPEICIAETIDSTEYNRLMSQGRIMADVVEQGKEWMTLRPLLALSNRKKVITNNINIKKERYYSKANIFILGEDDEDFLKEFIITPFKDIDSNSMAFYECTEWIKRFG